MNQKLKLQKKTTGETILEVLVSVAILSIVMTAAFVLFQKAIGVNINIRNRVAALSIAQEGIEAVRSLRDVNWMRFSGDRRKKWLCTDDPCVIGTDNLTGGHYYRVHYNPTTGVYDLESAVDSGVTQKALFDFNNTISGGNVFPDINDTETTEAGFYYLRRDLETGNPLAYRYTHDIQDPSANDNEPSLFFRQLYLDVQNPYGSSQPGFCDSDDETCKDSSLKIYSLVYWEEDGIPYNVQIEAYLFDYFQRKSY